VITSLVRGRPRPRWSWLLLALLGLAVAVRVYRLGPGLLTPDESFSWRLVQYRWPDVLRRTALDVHPPLYYLALKGWVAAWGDSPAALRGLSVLFGILCVPTAYLLCREACTGGWMRTALSPAAAGQGALLAAFLMAVHASQLAAGRTARMYSLGVFLAGLTAWLLLRALRARERRAAWWLAYALAVAAFCYTHYYAFFTVLAQGAFAFAFSLGTKDRTAEDAERRREEAPALPLRSSAPSAVKSVWKTGEPGRRLYAVAGYVAAGVVALALYSPWVPVVAAQTAAVHRDYWIPPLSLEAVQRTLLTWGTGLDAGATDEPLAWLILPAVLALVGAWRAGAAGGFFLLQALLPWVLCLAGSAATGRSVFVERYLVFAQLALFGLWGVTAAQLRSPWERALLALFLAAPALSGTWAALERLPADAPALEAAARFLQEHQRPGDTVLVDSPVDVNRLHYYAARAGGGPVVLRCDVNPFAHDLHASHAAVLDPAEWLGAGRPDGHRLWRGTEADPAMLPPPAGTRAVLTRRFTGGGSGYNLVLYDRRP
jgi:Dolichyl-phosphate-mannose-protein mannosyltransferase